jgi:hypothetical protein
MPVRTLYPRKPPSQCRAPPFYWRGGDVLREREYLSDEYKKAFGMYHRAALQLRQVEGDLQHAQETLHEREGYTMALANFLDADTEGNQTEQTYKRRLMKAEAEIQRAQAELQAAKAVHHPAVAGNLMREKAYVQIEIQRLRKAIDLAHEQDMSDRRRLAKISIGRRYQASLDIETKIIDLNGKCQYLRALVNKNKSDFDAIRPFPPLQSPDARLERAAYATLLDASYACSRAEEKKQRCPAKWDQETERLFWQVQLLNERMTELGMPEDQKVGIEALRSQFQEQPQGARDQDRAEQERAKEESANEGLPAGNEPTKDGAGGEGQANDADAGQTQGGPDGNGGKGNEVEETFEYAEVVTGTATRLADEIG